MGVNLRRWTMGAAAVSILALVLAGCGSSPTTSTSTPEPAWAKANEAIVPLPASVLLNAFNPILPLNAYSVYNSQATYLMYKPLVFITNSDGIDFSRSIAQSVAVSNNSQTFTVTLNPKWTWSNGNPVNSNDVAFTAALEAASCGSGAPYTYGGCGIGGLSTIGSLAGDGVGWMSIATPSATTFSITVNKPVSTVWFEHNGLGQIMPLPAGVWEQAAGIPGAAPGAAVPATSLTKAQLYQILNYMGGSSNSSNVMNSPTAAPYAVVDGPYLFKTMVPNDYWEFTVNPNYNGHMATIKTLVYQYYTSTAAEQAALEKGQLSNGYLTTASLAKKQLNIPGYVVKTGPPGFCFFYISLNLSPQAPNGLGYAFQDLKVRQALEYGIDQKAYIQVVGAGYGVQQYGPVPPQPVLSIFNGKAMPTFSYNPAKGKALLESDGWSLQNGVMTKTINGKSVALQFTMYYGTGSNANANFATLLARDWAQEGIKMTPSPMPFNSQIGLNDQNGGNVATTWAANWFGGWCYEPDYYPTGGGLFTATGFSNAGDFVPSAAYLAAIQAPYAPGTAAQSYAALTNYMVQTANLLPGDLWLPDLNTPTEVSPWIHGTMANFNAIQVLNFPNYWTISAP